MDLGISSFNIANFCLLYFEAVLISAYKFRILILPVGKKPFDHHKMSLFISSSVFP